MIKKYESALHLPTVVVRHCRFSRASVFMNGEARFTEQSTIMWQQISAYQSE
jgi:hypothetical protein